MNFVNVNWNGAAFVGNPIPTDKPISVPIQTNSCVSSFTNVGQTYTNHYEATTNARISSTKSSPKVSMNTYYQDSQRTNSNDILDEKYIPTAHSVVIGATSNGCNGLTPTPNSPKCAKSDKKSEIKKENNTTTSSQYPPDDGPPSMVAHVIMSARAQALQLDQATFSSISSLPLSILTSSKVKPEKSAKKSKSYSCNFCGHRTSQKQSLTQHVQSVHQHLKPFECKWEGCSYCCSTKQNLDKHTKAVHEKLKPNTCPFCDSSFSQKVTLDNHIRGVHSKIKPFQCPLCSYAAAYKGNLNSHIMSVHEKRKPFPCPAQCGYSCTQKSGLKRHKCS